MKAKELDEISDKSEYQDKLAFLEIRKAHGSRSAQFALNLLRDTNFKKAIESIEF